MLSDAEHQEILYILDQFKRRIVIVYKGEIYAPEIADIMVTEINKNDYISIFIAGECFG